MAQIEDSGNLARCTDPAHRLATLILIGPVFGSPIGPRPARRQ